MSETKYQYSEVNLLKTPQKYQMTPYEGINFLKNYKKSRKSALKTTKINYSLSSLEKKIHAEIKKENNKNSNESQKSIITQELLIKNISKISNHNMEIDNEIKILIKKFEITKKIFTEYNLKFEIELENNKHILNYLLLSYLCLKQFELKHNLKLLNISLKLNDTVISQIKNIKKEIEILLLNYVIKKELALIKELCVERGINI